MDLKLSHCFIFVSDQDEALKFYRDVLGLEVRTDAKLDMMRWLTVGPKSQPDIEIGLMAPGVMVADEGERKLLGDLMTKGMTVRRDLLDRGLRWDV